MFSKRLMLRRRNKMRNHKIEKIYNEYYPIVYKYLCCITNSQDLAEDLTQETFYKMIRHIDSFKGNCKLSSWLCEIAKNLWYDELRKNKRKTMIIQNIKESSQENIEENFIHKEELSITYQKMNQLDKETKRVMYLRIHSELSFKEIGQILGKTENWARVTFYRGKKKVKESDSYEK